MSREIIRFTVNVNKELADRVDKYAEDMNVNRTAAVSILLSQALDARDALVSMSGLIKAIEDVRQSSGKEETSLS